MLTWMCALLRTFLLFVGIAHAAAAKDAAAYLARYHVFANVTSRMATTSVDMVFANPNDDCSDARSFTLQLPRNARLTNLVMDLSDGCALDSAVKALDEAKADFENLAEEGKAAALVTASWDMTNYDLRVSVPPGGTTNVTLQYQELLYQKLEKVEFQVPFFPGMSVEELRLNIHVEDGHSGMLEFGTDDVGDDAMETTFGESISTARYLATDVPAGSSLPTLLKAYYRPGPLPDNGLMLVDGGDCFTHLFNPSKFLSTAGSMARRIVFVIDVSGSMDGSKLDDAKASFASMIDTLDERDTLIVQAFSDAGTEKLWGPKSATDGNKAGAKEFVQALKTIGGTNLNDAFLDGIRNVYEVPQEVAPVLVILTDGQGNVGPEVTAKSVREANEGQRVKIFSLAFGFDADMDLLLGIAIQNGGKAVRIYEGYGDAVSQMELFYRQELGTIMLSDIDVSYDFGGVTVLDRTQSSFPVLASGSEVVVRGRVDSPLLASDGALKSSVSAKSNLGLQEWSSEHLLQDGVIMASDCRSSFAQARIEELLEYRDAQRALGDNLFGADAAESSSTLSFEEQAREIALEADLVWPGLTALVTLENTACPTKQYDVCSTAEGEVGEDHEDDLAEEAELAADISSPSASPPPGGRYGSVGSGGCSLVLRSCLLMSSVAFGAFFLF